MSPLVVSVPTVQLADDLLPLPAGVEVVVWGMDSPAPRPRFDIVVPPYMGFNEVLLRLSGVSVGLVQSQSIGYDGVAELLPAGLRFANAASVHETSTAELAVALTLAAQRQLPAFVRQQAAGQWEQIFASSLADRRVLLLGYGGVGRAVARRLRPFEVELIPVASTSREQDGLHVHAMADLAALLPSAEVMIVTLPGGEATRGVVDDGVLAALPDGALVVNVGRGSLIDTEALTEHVRRGRLRAALDVTEPEPLPPDHPLWHLDGVLLSPHVGGATSAMRPRVARLVRQQIERMLAGEEPLNVVLGAD